jgi:methanogenic corrinoid protein MtbC1
MYPADIVGHLEMISEALDRGHRASNVVGLSRGELEKLLEVNGHRSSDQSDGGTRTDTNSQTTDSPADSGRQSDEAKKSRQRQPRSGGVPSLQVPDQQSSTRSTASDRNEDDAADPHDDEQPAWMSEWMDAVDNLDGELLDLYFRNAWNRMGGLDFIRHRAAPFLMEIGRRWQLGELDVAHEHYTSQCLQDFLSTHWRPLSDRNEGPSVICATFSGEQHALGLHFAAIVLAMAGWQVVFLGPSTPHRDILRTAEIKQVDAVLISLSDAFNSTIASQELQDLREILPGEIDLLVGGSGASDEAIGRVDETIRFDSMMDFYEWSIDRVR